MLAGLSELDPRAFGGAPFQVNERRRQDHQPAVEVALCPVPNGNHLLVVGVLLRAEGHLTRRLFGAIVRRIAALPALSG